MHIAKPINQLVSGDNTIRKRNHIEWTTECPQAFEQLKQLQSRVGRTLISTAEIEIIKDIWWRDQVREDGRLALASRLER